MTAQISYQASENAANRAQQVSERSIEEENKRKRDEFLRDQRVLAYKQFLSDSKLAEDAQLDYLAALSRQATLNINDYLSDMETKNRQFNNSAWGMEFFSPPKLRDAARVLATELYERQLMLRNYNGTSAQFRAITERVETNGRAKIVELRQKFADYASEVLSS